jgi:hypothetical protein
VLSTGEKVTLGMMDRRLYLEDTIEDRNIITALRAAEYQEFLKLFVTRMCQLNQAPEKSTDLIRKIKLKLLSRSIRTVFDRQESFIGKFNVMLSTLEDENVPIPYQWQLRIRNEFIAKKKPQLELAA